MESKEPTTSSSTGERPRSASKIQPDMARATNDIQGAQAAFETPSAITSRSVPIQKTPIKARGTDQNRATPYYGTRLSETSSPECSSETSTTTIIRKPKKPTAVRGQAEVMDNQKQDEACSTSKTQQQPHISVFESRIVGLPGSKSPDFCITSISNPEIRSEFFHRPDPDSPTRERSPSARELDSSIIAPSSVGESQESSDNPATSRKEGLLAPASSLSGPTCTMKDKKSSQVASNSGPAQLDSRPLQPLPQKVSTTNESTVLVPVFSKTKKKSSSPLKRKTTASYQRTRNPSPIKPSGKLQSKFAMPAAGRQKSRWSPYEAARQAQRIPSPAPTPHQMLDDSGLESFPSRGAYSTKPAYPTKSSSPTKHTESDAVTSTEVQAAASEERTYSTEAAFTVKHSQNISFFSPEVQAVLIRGPAPPPKTRLQTGDNPPAAKVGDVSAPQDPNIPTGYSGNESVPSGKDTILSREPTTPTEGSPTGRRSSTKAHSQTQENSIRIVDETSDSGERNSPTMLHSRPDQPRKKAARSSEKDATLDQEPPSPLEEAPPIQGLSLTKETSPTKTLSQSEGSSTRVEVGETFPSRERTPPTKRPSLTNQPRKNTENSSNVKPHLDPEYSAFKIANKPNRGYFPTRGAYPGYTFPFKANPAATHTQTESKLAHAPAHKVEEASSHIDVPELASTRVRYLFERVDYQGESGTYQAWEEIDPAVLRGMKRERAQPARPSSPKPDSPRGEQRGEDEE